MSSGAIQFTKRILATHIHEQRRYYIGLGWKSDDCTIIADPCRPVVRLESDSGVVDFTFESNDRIRRDAFGKPSTFIDFVEMEIADRIARHNQRIDDEILLQRTSNSPGAAAAIA